MKTILFTCLFLAIRSVSWGTDFYLSAAESYVFNFTSFSFLRSSLPTDPSDGTLFGFTGGNYTVRTELFANSLSDPPLFDDTFSHSGSSEATGFGIQFGFAPWPDFQGVARVTAISGTLELDGMRVDEVVNGGYYSTGWIEPVPEPSAMAMVAAGAAGLLACHARRRRPAQE